MPALTLTTWTGPIWPLLGTTGLLGWPGSLTKLVLPALVVVPPSFLTGMTLPLMVFAVVQRQGALRGQGMWLYAANTLGGVLGLLATVRITLPWLGAAGAMSWAIALNLIVALGCLETSRHRAWVNPPRTGPAAGSTAAADRVRPAAFRGSLVVSFGSGFGILALEILALHLY